MAHFYGSIEGQAGPATRMGSKRSGYTAWAQNDTGRVLVTLEHIDGDRDGAWISITPSTRGYTPSTSIPLGTCLNLSALVKHGDDPQVRQALDVARAALQDASAYASELEVA